MSYLSRSRIYFDEVRVAGLCFQHEIEPVHAGKIEPTSQFFGSGSHFLVVDQAQNGGVARGAHFIDHFKMETGQDLTVPTSDGACCFASRNKCLRIYDKATAK